MTANSRLESYGARSMRRSQHCPARTIWWNSISSAIRRLPIRISRYRHEQLARDGAVVRWLPPFGVLLASRRLRE